MYKENLKKENISLEDEMIETFDVDITISGDVSILNLTESVEEKKHRQGFK